MHEPAVRIFATGGDQAMHVRMNTEIASPRMQSRNNSRSRSEILRIGEQRFERLSGGLQQSLGEARSIELPERVQLFGNGKDDVHMLAGQQVRRGSVEPVGSSPAAALRAASVSAGIVLNVGDMAAVTA